MAEDKKLKKLNLILQAFFKAFEETHLSKEEFTKAIKIMLVHIKKIEDRNEKVIEDMQRTFLEKTSEFIENNSGIKIERKKIQSIKDLENDFVSVRNELKKVSDNTSSKLTTEIRSSFTKLFKEQNNTLNFMRDKVRMLKPGKDADETKIVEELKKEIVSLDEIKNLIDDINQLSADDVADKLETLKGDKRLKASAIWGLEKFIKRGFQGLKGSATVPSPQNWAKHEAFTMNGTDTSVTLADGIGGGGNALIVRYQGNTLDMTTHYTTDGNKVSFTFTPDNATTISITFWQ